MLKFPAIFFGHGSPMNAIEENQYTKSWKKIVKTFPKPKAIISISAHWETEGSRVTNNKKQETIHDFYGFPQELFDVKYNASGDENLAQRIQKLIPSISLDSNWGLDHGSWSILTHAYPRAEIPVIQISLDKNKSVKEHYEFAKQLRVLRREEILIIGSGNVVHNLRMINWRENKAYSWAIEFNEAIKNSLLQNNQNGIDEILNYEKFSGAHESVPTLEHFLPLIYILGLKEDGENFSIFCDGIELGSISMMSVVLR